MVAVLALIAGAGALAHADFSPDRPNGVKDPCRTPKVAKKLLCPDLRIGKPSEMYLDRELAPGRALLRATNDIRSRGQGPMELRGHRDRPRSMNVTQAIRKRGGGYSFFPTQGRLRYFNVGYQWGGAYWKVRDPLRFELWRVNANEKKVRLVRTGPKQFYCFRDLARTWPAFPRSPDHAVYPACNQNPKVRNVTLGTSVGWSDIYPSTYDQQWIDVTGLRGCFAYVLHLDPGNFLFELNKRNNYAQRIVRLPWRGYARRGC
ncbi:MAG TPA: lysyl oxidase family protein [Solirubrobacterales bacterium]|nr:hypothetical protein [Solirubrobacterales bacterium]HRV60690.1 lysyl oxidase family protein [Solirubrobacterales bacterium]